MKFFGRDFPGFAGLLVFFVMLLLISGGLCGLQYAVLSITNKPGGGENALVGIFMLTGIIELLAMAVAAGGIVLVALTWLVFTVFRIPFPQPRGENLSILQSSDDKEKSDQDSQ